MAMTTGLVQTKLRTTTSSGTPILVSATLEYKEGRIWFVKSPYSLKDEIRAMRGSKWHNFDDEPKKMWSVEDCQRNRFQLSFLMGEDTYAWFDQPRVFHEYTRPLKEHQKELSDNGLTYHYHIFAAEMGTGKTLSAQEVMERSGVDWWFWVGPKTSLPNIKREFRKWESEFVLRLSSEGVDAEPGRKVCVLFTYEGLKPWVEQWKPGQPLPGGLICDEASRLKGAESQRSRAVQALADLIREHYGLEKGYVIEMSGTPAPKKPTDWWRPCEIAWPGFLREGSSKALEERLGFLVLKQFDSGAFKQNIGWKDDERKCAECGALREDGPHELDGLTDPEAYHPFKSSVNEVAYLGKRLQGLVTVKHKKDCLDLPEKRYRKIICRPTASLLRTAEAIVQAAPNGITAMTLLRELSDGFQYREEQDGMTRCTHCQDGKVTNWLDPQDSERSYPGVDLLPPDVVARLVEQVVTCPVCGGAREVPKIVRKTREIPCPKDAALKMLLDENLEVGRLIAFGGFTGSIDRIARLCLQEKWDVVRCDQGTFQILTHDGSPVKEEALDYWANLDHPRVTFDANPESGGLSFTLVEARTTVYWSNSWKPEFRVQSEDRAHRIGMDVNKGGLIVDLIHLPSDERVLEVIRANRKLELMTMGELMEGVRWETTGDEGTMQVEEAVT